MGTGEVPISQINPGDSVFYDRSVHEVRGRMSVTHPPRTILITQAGDSISLPPSTLIERVSAGGTFTKYEGPSWVCGLPEKVEVSSLEPGDLVVEPDAEVVAGKVRAANGFVLITTKLSSSDDTRIRFHRSADRLRLLAKGLPASPWTGASTVDGLAREVLATDLSSPCEVVLSQGVVKIAEISKSDSEVVLNSEDGETYSFAPSASLVAVVPKPAPEPAPIGALASSLAFRCANGHVTTIAQQLMEGQRFIDCPNCGLPATSLASNPPAPSQPATTAAGPAVAKFCGECGRARKPENAFCTGCGNRFSKLDTTGFRS